MQGIWGLPDGGEHSSLVSDGQILLLLDCEVISPEP